MRHAITALLTLAGLAAFSGCTTHPVPPGIEGYRFEDIPSPHNFSEDDFNSYGHIYQRFSVYTIVFRGNDRLENLARFYRDQMPQFGWTLVNEVTAPAPVLTFENFTERCTVTLTDDVTGDEIVTIKRDVR